MKSRPSLGKKNPFINNSLFSPLFRYWVQNFSPSYGNCFTFNSAYNDDDPSTRKASLTGVSSGLSIELYLDQRNYMLNKLSKKAGARMVLHGPEEPPLPDEYGLDLQPNTASSIAIQLVSQNMVDICWDVTKVEKCCFFQTEITRLPDPHPAKCIEFWNQTEYDQEVIYTMAVRISYIPWIKTIYSRLHLLGMSEGLLSSRNNQALQMLLSDLQRKRHDRI